MVPPSHPFERSQQMKTATITACRTRAQQIAAWMNKTDQFGYFEIEVAGESLGWFAATKDKITHTTREIVAERYGERVAHAFDVNKHVIQFHSQEELDELSDTKLMRPVDFSGLPAYIFGAPQVKSDDRRNQPATDTYDWMGGTP